MKVEFIFYVETMGQIKDTYDVSITSEDSLLDSTENTPENTPYTSNIERFWNRFYIVYVYACLVIAIMSLICSTGCPSIGNTDAEYEEYKKCNMVFAIIAISPIGLLCVCTCIFLPIYYCRTRT